MPRIAPAALIVTLAVASAAGCKPMKPRPAVAPPLEPPAAAKAEAPEDGPDSGYRSTSSLGKARDAALRTRDRMDAYQREVAKQADDVFKNP